MDIHNNIIYIGKTCSHNPQLRFNSHSTQGNLPEECYNSINIIEICELNSEADVETYEPYLINLYKPKYNNQFKTNDSLTITLPDLKWLNKDEYIENIKIKELKYKETIEYKKFKAENRKNKGKIYTKFTDWLNKQNKGREIKFKEILIETELNNDQFKKLKQNNSYVKTWFNVHKGNKRGYYVI